MQPGDLVSTVDRPARRQSCVRPDGDRPDSHRRRPRVEPGARGLTRHSRRQPARRRTRQCRSLAFLQRARERRIERRGDPGRLAAGAMAIERQRSKRNAARAGDRGLADDGPPRGQGEPRPPALSTSSLAAGTAGQRRSACTGTGGGRPGAAAGQREGPAIGLDPALFGQQPGGPAIDSASIAVQAPRTLAIRLPADLVAGCEFVTGGALMQPTRRGRERAASVARDARRARIAGRVARPAGRRRATDRRRAADSRRRSTRSGRFSRPPFATPRSCRWTRSSR